MGFRGLGLGLRRFRCGTWGFRLGTYDDVRLAYGLGV